MDPHIIERSERGNKGESDSSSKEEEELTIEAKRSRIPRQIWSSTTYGHVRLLLDGKGSFN